MTLDGKRLRLTLMLAAVLLLSAVAPAVGVTVRYTIYCRGTAPTSLGIGYARLTKTRTYNISKLGTRSYSGIDANYAQKVYLDCWGAKLTSGVNRGKYPLQMDSRYWSSAWRTFAFTVYSTAYYTPQGIHVGSYASQVRTKYGTALRKMSTPTYTIYALTGSNSSYRWRTEFYVPVTGATYAGRVKFIRTWLY